MLTRREFVKLCAAGFATAAFPQLLMPHLSKAVEYLGKRPPVIWLELNTCTGNFLSFLNTMDPGLLKIINEMIDLRFSNQLMVGEGYTAIEALYEIPERFPGEYILIAEGTIATKAQGKYGVIGNKLDGTPLTQLEAARHFSPKAKYIIAAGTCAAFGGPFAANPNPSNSQPLHKVVKEQVINVPGCPIHPDWLVGTLTHLLLYGMPDLDADNRPKDFYGKLIHDHCPRRNHFNNGNFAKHPGDVGCTFLIGCKGPVTFSDCPTRQWISTHNSWPVEANTPCIGCVSPGFPDQMSPFFVHLPNINVPGTAVNIKTFGLLAGGATLVGIGGHLLFSIVKGRVYKNLVGGTQTSHVGEELVNKQGKDKEKETVINKLRETADKTTHFQRETKIKQKLANNKKSTGFLAAVTRKLMKMNKEKLK